MTATKPSLVNRDPALAPNVIKLPVVLLLGCSPSFEARCRDVASRARALVRSYQVPFSRSLVKSLRPLVIVVPDEIFELAPRGFEVLADEVNASLLNFENERLAPMVLEYRLTESLVFATKLRDRMAASFGS